MWNWVRGVVGGEYWGLVGYYWQISAFGCWGQISCLRASYSSFNPADNADIAFIILCLDNNFGVPTFKPKYLSQFREKLLCLKVET